MNPPPLSIVMASCNDANQTVLTIASIRETAPEDVEIIVVDDCSATPLVHYVKRDERTHLVTNAQRCGCGPSRHIGAMYASADWLLICDSHMRFEKGWFEKWEKTTLLPFQMERSVWCATCLGLDSKHMEPENPVSEYHGATMNFYGTDRLKLNAPMQVFEAVWLPKSEEPEDGAEIPAVMGAAYFVSRDWFLHLSPTRYLRTWGCDEQMISMKSWLAGGSVRMAKSVRIGHKFLMKNEVQRFGVPQGHVIWNKMFAITTLLPDDLATCLFEKLTNNPKEQRDVEVAKKMFRDDYHLVAQERAFNQSIFVHDAYWYADKFRIPLPS
jgi:glycosyltransferase involved in cell wall biosynthesis